MPPTLTSRKAARAQLKTVLKAGIETLLEELWDVEDVTLAAYESEAKDFGGLSPVLTVHSDGTMTTFTDYAREYHRFWVSLYWKRDDADTIEDALDDLAWAARQTLIDNSEEQGYWHDLDFDESFSEMAYLIIDGVQYRSERLRVIAYSVCDNGGIPEP